MSCKKEKTQVEVVMCEGKYIAEYYRKWLLRSVIIDSRTFSWCALECGKPVTEIVADYARFTKTEDNNRVSGGLQFSG